MREIEIKYPLADLAALRDRLGELAAQHVGRFLELNRMLDYADGRLRAAGAGLRLRSTQRLTTQAAQAPSGIASKPPAPPRARHILTYKGPLESSGPIRVRPEFETRVADADAILCVLASLGIVERLRFDKRREVWRVPNAEITIDELPRLGWYCEIEAATEREINELAARLQLAALRAEARTYPALVAAIAAPAADGVAALQFTEV